MPANYIPQKDGPCDAWAQNFATVITAAPTSYGLDAGQASAFTTLSGNYTTALALATDPGTRTQVTVAAKDTAKNLMVANARQLALIAQQYPGITDELLSDAGLTIRDPVRSPIPTPTTTPVLSLIANSVGQMTLRYTDSVLVNPRSKPPGAIGLQLWCLVGTAAPAGPEACLFKQLITRMPGVVTFDAADKGKQAYFYARWYTQKGLLGPWSDLFQATVMG
jgi:hypothetical protein